ncbi:hypothetical protein IIA79_03615 [bacterium]|nr:hypothetical protein [bacterium]
MARIAFDDGGEPASIDSNTVELQLFAELTDARIDEISAQLSDYHTQLEELRESMTPADAAVSLIATLEADPTISAAGVLAGDDGVWYETSEGLGCSIYFPDDIIYGGDFGTSSARSIPPPVNDSESLGTPAVNKSVSAIDPDIPGNRKVLILAPYEDDFGTYADAKSIKSLFENFNSTQDANSCYRYEIEYYENEECTIERLLSMDQYGIVVIITHGYHLFGKSRVALLSRTEYVEGVTKFSDEIKLLLSQGFFSFSRFKLNSGAEVQGLALSNKYVEEKFEMMPKSLVYLGACFSAVTPVMSTALTNIGAETVYGFDKKVNYVFAKDVCVDLFEALLEGKHTEEVFSQTPQLGVEPYTYPFQENDAKLVKVPPGKKQKLLLKLYDLREIMPLPGFDFVWVTDINNKGQILGMCDNDLGSQIVLWQVNPDRTLTHQLIGSPAAHYAMAINDSGLVVGYKTVEFDMVKMFHVFSAESSNYTNLVDLDPLNVQKASYAYDVNNQGTITGQAHWYYDPPYDPEKGIWSGAKAMVYSSIFTDLGVFIDARDWQGSYQGIAINELGEVVGYARKSQLTKPFFYRDNVMYSLPEPEGSSGAIPKNINDSSWVVGSVNTGNATVPYMWASTSDAHFRLPGLGGISGIAMSVNNSLQVVGVSGEAGAVLWEKDESAGGIFDYRDYSVYDLNCLLTEPTELKLTEARKINDAGQIIGILDYANAFVLLPVAAGT